MKEILNKKIKYREEFRPFAPAVLEEHADKYFNTNSSKIPFMNCTVKANKKLIKKMYSAVHVDGTSRVQTVSKKMNIKFYNLINSFYKITGVPILINTSFNLKGQPIVETPRDALMTFYGSGIDYLVLGPYLISKNRSLSMKTKYDFKSIFKNKLNSLFEKFHYNISEIDKTNIDIKKIKKIKNKDEQLSSAKKLVQKYPNDPKAHLNFAELLYRNFNKDWIPHSHEYAKKEPYG